MTSPMSRIPFAFWRPYQPQGHQYMGHRHMPLFHLAETHETAGVLYLWCTSFSPSLTIRYGPSRTHARYDYKCKMFKKDNTYSITITELTNTIYIRCWSHLYILKPFHCFWKKTYACCYCTCLMFWCRLQNLSKYDSVFRIYIKLFHSLSKGFFTPVPKRDL